MECWFESSQDIPLPSFFSTNDHTAQSSRPISHIDGALDNMESTVRSGTLEIDDLIECLLLS
jgi:hypothetical protein